MARLYTNAYVEGDRLILLRRGECGELIREEEPASHAAYFRDLDPDKDRILRKWARSVSREGEWTRAEFRSREDRRDVCFERDNVARMRRLGDRWRQEDVVANPLYGTPSYEADVDPITRFFSDTGAGIQRPRRCYLDLETDSRVPFASKEKARILCWSVTDDARNTVSAALGAWTDDSERRLVSALWHLLAAYDQVASWNGDGFDFPVILARSDHLDVETDVRHLLLTDHMVAFRRMNMHAAESGEEKRSFALGAILEALKLRGKDDFDASKTYEHWAAGGEMRRKLVAYNRRDVESLADVEHKTGFLDLFTTICEVCRVFPSTSGLLPTRQLDGFLLRMGVEKGRHFASREPIRHDEGEDGDEEDDAPKEKFRGAYVMEPKSLDAGWRMKRGMTDGFLRDVHVADFASFYPACIITWNMSSEKLVTDAPVNGPIPEGCARCPTTGTVFRVDDGPGLLAEAVSEMLRLRKFWSDTKASLPPGTPEWVDADRRSNAYKVTANSFFGATGSPFSRHYERRVAEGITQNAEWLIRQTIHAAEQRGWDVVYTDTDSIFVIGCSREEFSSFVEWCNASLYPELLKRQGCRENRIKIAYEKQFDFIVFAAKKRYVAVYRHYKGKAATKDSKPEVKGFEYKRGDAARLAAEMQGRAIKMITSGQHDPGAYHDLVADFRRRVLEDDMLAEQIVVSKAVTKRIGKWDPKEKRWLAVDDGYSVGIKKDGTPAASPPHVEVARMLWHRGRDVSPGTRIAYFVIDNEASDSASRFAPAEDFKGDFDRHYLWESVVYPATCRLLLAAFPAQSAHWVAWERSRPRASRGRKAVAEGQSALFAEGPSRLRTSGIPEPPRPAASGGEQRAAS